MQLLVFTAIGLVAYLVSYAVGLGGTVAGLIFLTFLTIGAVLRVSQPLLVRFKP